MRTINKKFLLEIENQFGTNKYSGLSSDTYDSYGTTTCTFSEKDKCILISVDPESGEESANELRLIIPIALRYYPQIGLIFDDRIYLLEFLSLTYPHVYKNLLNQKKEGTLKKKKDIPIDRDIKKFLIEYTVISSRDLHFEVQDVEGVYGIVIIKKMSKTEQKKVL